jgi:hypothetical protein
MKKSAIALAALLAASAAHAQPVDVGTGDWANLPEARQTGQSHLGSAVAAAVEGIARKGDCKVAGLGPRGVDISVPFTLKFSSSWRVERIVLRDLGCPELETLLGRVVQRLAAQREFVAPNGPGWYRSVFDLTVD